MHTTVLLEEVLDALQPRPNVDYRVLDCTVGAGGHSFGLLERSAPDGFLIGLDADPSAIEAAARRLAPFTGRFRLIQRNFEGIRELDLEPVDGIVFDLGLSSPQLDASGRGFAFRFDEPLDMRFDPDAEQPTAADLLNDLPEPDLERILRAYGEEPRARRLAHTIVQRRARQKFERTPDLVAAVTSALGPQRGRIHPATRAFQALRIAVNDELAALESALDQSIQILKPEGRLAVISFHSLEDRIVKWRMRGWATDGRVSLVNKKPIIPGDEEIRANPRARSAKLRVAERSAA